MPPAMMIKITRYSFGGTCAIVSPRMALITGLNAATATVSAIIGSLMIVVLADNLAASLRIHIYRESERLEPR